MTGLVPIQERLLAKHKLSVWLVQFRDDLADDYCVRSKFEFSSRVCLRSSASACYEISEELATALYLLFSIVNNIASLFATEC